MRRIRTGENDAATAFFLKYANRVENIARRETAADLRARFDEDDVVQSVFRTFFRRTVEGQYDVPDGDEVWKLLLVITLNKIRGLAVHHRAQKRNTTRTQPVDELQEGTEPASLSSDHLSMLESVIRDVLKDKPALQQEIIQRRIDGDSVEEIANQVKRSRRTVERVLQQFRSSLLEKLREDGVADA